MRNFFFIIMFAHLFTSFSYVTKYMKKPPKPNNKFSVSKKKKVFMVKISVWFFSQRLIQKKRLYICIIEPPMLFNSYIKYWIPYYDTFCMFVGRWMKVNKQNFFRFNYFLRTIFFLLHHLMHIRILFHRLYIFYDYIIHNFPNHGSAVPCWGFFFRSRVSIR